MQPRSPIPTRVVLTAALLLSSWATSACNPIPPNSAGGRKGGAGGIIETGSGGSAGGAGGGGLATGGGGGASATGGNSAPQPDADSGVPRPEVNEVAPSAESDAGQGTRGVQ
ncbi:MAG TPA: hypothetical protein VGG33_21715, partial [Polyangia bacterium]